MEEGGNIGGFPVRNANQTALFSLKGLFLCVCFVPGLAFAQLDAASKSGAGDARLQAPVLSEAAAPSGATQLKTDSGLPERAGPQALENTARFSPGILDAVRARDRNRVRELIDAGAELEEKGDLGETPLMRAVEMNLPEIAQELIDAGADVNAQASQSGFTGLMMAAARFPDMVSLLLESGADPNLKSHLGIGPLDVARSAGNREVVEMLETAAVLREGERLATFGSARRPVTGGPRSHRK